MLKKYQDIVCDDHYIENNGEYNKKKQPQYPIKTFKNHPMC